MTNELKEWNTIADWFQAKSGISAYAFNDRQIVGETEKALKVRTAVARGNGLSVVKEVWKKAGTASISRRNTCLGIGRAFANYPRRKGETQ